MIAYLHQIQISRVFQLLAKQHDTILSLIEF